MSKKEAVISIKGTQFVDEQSDATELSVVGTLKKTDKGFVIEYDDYESVTGGKTVIALGDGALLMTRYGDITTEMYFKEGERSNSEYSTPYGNMTVGIYTVQLAYAEGENAVTVLLEYNIDFNSGFAARNILEISVNIKN
ncbi:MAG TPA: hypothetical protein DCR23_00245 [Ruminococcaceae bacterium]|nr:hypothetical protein [Oscillospiraceae bacterium]